MQFKYDPFGRRIEKISPNATSIFAYDGDNLVETASASGGEVARYTQGQNIDQPLAMERGSTTDYYEADGLGSITSLTASNGTLAQSYTYDSFGNTTNSSGSLTNFFRYTGREFDTETNLYYYRARYYDSTTARFLSEDPIGFRGGIDLYAYVYDDPTDLADPWGMEPDTKYKCNLLGVCYLRPTTPPVEKRPKLPCHLLPSGDELKNFVCGTSMSDEVMSSMRDGAIAGAAEGAAAGIAGGGLFAGVGAVPGAIGGGVVGGISGAGGGALQGAATALICNLFGAYGK